MNNGNGGIVTSGGNITVFLAKDNKTYCVDKSHANYNEIANKVRKSDFNGIDELINGTVAIKKFVERSGTGLGNDLVIGENSITYKGYELNGLLVNKILEFTRNKYDAQPLIKFLSNLMENPSKASVDTLYNFLDKYGLVITQDGYFVAYKKVRDDLKDYHSGKFDNSIGKIVSVPRNTVDDNPGNACSYGLHVGSVDYAHNQFHPGEGKLLTVLVNPKDVVSVTTDCNWAKIRTCEYVVLGFNDDAKEVTQGSTVNTVDHYNDSYDDSIYDHEDDEDFDDDEDESSEYDDDEYDDDYDDDDDDDEELDDWANEDDDEEEEEEEDDEEEELDSEGTDWSKIKVIPTPEKVKKDKKWWQKFFS